MAWSTLNFGKHKGNTLPQIVLTDPDWFFWAYENEIFKGARLKKEAEEIYRKATSIRMPQTGSEKLVVEYVIHPTTMKFGHFESVPASRPVHEGSSPTYRLDVIDLSFPRRLASYDKLGCKHMIKSLKFHYFGSSERRLTKRKCEDFFNENDNFKL